MSRKVRMVPPGWQHPVEWRKHWQTGRPEIRFVPLYDGDPVQQAKEWDDEKIAWERGEDRSCASFEEWSGERPKAEDYMPTFAPGTATHLMMYETTSEGTPVSPAFATPEELAHWLADNNASAFGSDGATYDQWLRVCKGGYAPSAVMTSAGLQSGVAGLTD